MTQKYQVKVSMKQAAIVETGIVLKQGDFGMQLEIEVIDFDATGTTPQIVFRKAMGAVESTTITVSGNKYTYTFKGTELDTPGKVFCDLKLKNSTTQRISTASFMFRVVADTLDGLAEESSSYSDTIAQIVAGFEDEIVGVQSEFDGKVDDIKRAIGIDGHIFLTLEKGDINPSTGADQASNYIYRSGYFTASGKLNVSIPANHQMGIFEYDSSYNFINKLGITQQKSKVYCKADSYYRIIFTKNPVALPDSTTSFDLVVSPLEEQELNLRYILGGINNSGQDEGGNAAYHSEYISVSGKNIIKLENLSSLYEYRLYTYDSSMAFLHRINNVENGQCYIVSDGYIRLLFRLKTGSSLTNNFMNAPTVYKYNNSSVFDENQKIYFEGWSQGSIDATTGYNENQPNVIRTGYLDNVLGTTLIIKKNSGYATRVYYYEDDRSPYCGCDLAWDENPVSICIPKTNTARVLCKKIPTSATVPADGVNVSLEIASNGKQEANETYNTVNAIVESTYRSSIMYGKTITEVGNLNTIIGHADTDDEGMVYVGLEVSDTTAYESADDAYAQLLIFNIIDPSTIERYTAVKPGDTLPYINPFFGTEETITKAWDTLAMRIDEDTIRIITKVFTNTTAEYQVYRDFDLETKTFTDFGVLYTRINDSDVVMWGNNNADIRTALNLAYVDSNADGYALLMNTRIERVTVNNTLWYYTEISYGYKSHVLIKSTDLITWIPVSEIPVPYPTEEIQVILNGSTLYTINRADYTQKDDIYVWPFNPSAATWGTPLILKKPGFGNERPCVAVIGGNLYIQQCFGNVSVDSKSMPRTLDAYIRVDLKRMRETARVVVPFDVPVVYPEFIKIGRSIYMIACTDKRGYFMNGSDGRQELTLTYFDYRLMDIVAEY